MKKHIKIIPLFIAIFAFMSLCFLGGCGDDGSTSFISTTGPTGATGATGPDNVYPLRINVSHGGQAVGEFEITLTRIGTSESSGIEDADSSGQGWYEFDNLLAGDYSGTITSETHETRYFGVTVPVTGNEVSFTMGQWALQDSGITTTAPQLKGVAFADSTTGWAVGWDTYTRVPLITHTTDGESWTPQTPPSDPNYPYSCLNDVSFIDSTTGWAVGNKYSGGTGLYAPLIINTTDGSAWNLQTAPNVIDPNTTYTYENLLGVDFIDSTTGWAAGYYRDPNTSSYHPIIMNTTDGSNWNLQTAPTGSTGYTLSDVDFTDSQNGWAIGPKYILHTSDGGANWEIQSTVGNSSYPSETFKIHFLNSSTGWYCNGYGIFKSTDGGATWQEENFQGIPSNYSGIQCFFFIDEETAWAAGEALGHKDIYSGWVEQYKIQGVTENPYLRDITFPNSQTGWAVGNDGVIIHYSE